MSTALVGLVKDPITPGGAGRQHPESKAVMGFLDEIPERRASHPSGVSLHEAPPIIHDPGEDEVVAAALLLDEPDHLISSGVHRRQKPSVGLLDQRGCGGPRRHFDDDAMLLQTEQGAPDLALQILVGGLALHGVEKLRRLGQIGEPQPAGHGLSRLR